MENNQPTKKKEGGEQKRLWRIFTLEIIGVFVWISVIWLSALPNPLYTLIQSETQQSGEAWVVEFLAVLFFAILAIVLLKHLHIFGTVVSILLGFMIFSGATLFLGPELALILSVSLVLFERFGRSFLSNNVLLMIAVGFGAIPLGAAYPTEMLIWAIVVLSIYDIFGVFFTQFIPNLAKQASQKHIPLIFVAPTKNHIWLHTPQPKKTSAILGAGDVFLPSIFLSSVTIHSNPTVAIWVLGGTIIGMVGNTILAKYIKTGIPAMPLLSLGMLVAYFLTK